MTPKTLEMVAVELYGPNWKGPLCEALSTSERTVRRWAAGTLPIPENVRTELLAIAHSKMDQLEDVIAELERGAD